MDYYTNSNIIFGKKRICNFYAITPKTLDRLILSDATVHYIDKIMFINISEFEQSLTKKGVK